MPKIFVSYRRDDSAYAATAIADRLASKFGHDSVFFDVDTIPPGVDFRDYLNDAVSYCDVLLAVIGDQWLATPYQDGPLKGRRRLDDPQDFVRVEIEAALSRQVKVIPVLVGRASMPSEKELPESLNRLAYRNAVEVRPGRDFSNHVERLIRELEKVEAAAQFKAPGAASRKIFLCHSQKDRSVADLITGVIRVTGDTCLQDLAALKSGVSWDQWNNRLIEEADIFILLWSWNLQSSEFARREWRYALSLNRPYFIRPVYFEDPLPPSPEELADIHFMRLPNPAGN